MPRIKILSICVEANNDGHRCSALGEQLSLKLWTLLATVQASSGPLPTVSGDTPRPSIRTPAGRRGAARLPPSPSTIGFMRSRAALPILLLALALPLSAQSPGGEKITNGVLDPLHPTVGLFIVDGECTATLIGCRTVLTAAHCICGDHLGGVKCTARPDLVDPAGKLVFFQNAGLFALSSLAVDPAYNAYTGVSDVAILHLARPVTNIAPSPLNRTGHPPLGSPGVIVG